MSEFPNKPWGLFNASIWGMSFPWTLIASMALGVLLMFCPTWFGIDIQTRAADIGHLGGALIVTVSVICMGEVVRVGRYLNVLLALVVAIGPWLVERATGYAITSSVIGIAVLVLAIPRGPKTESYGEWDRYVRLAKLSDGGRLNSQPRELVANPIEPQLVKLSHNS